MLKLLTGHKKPLPGNNKDVADAKCPVAREQEAGKECCPARSVVDSDATLAARTLGHGVMATRIVWPAEGKEAAVHYEPGKTPAHAVKAQIVAKLGLSSHVEFYLQDTKGRPVLDLAPAQLKYFESLTLVTGRAKHATESVLPRTPIFGNAHQLAGDFLAAIVKFREAYGVTYKLHLFHQPVHITSSPDIVAGIARESPFFSKRLLSGPLVEVRDVGGVGLFTVDSDNPEWEPAHKLLIPTFSAGAMKQYMGDMSTQTLLLARVLDQLVDTPIALGEFTTRYTLETIAACGFGYSFHLLDSPDAPMHPFVHAMNYCLNASKYRTLFSNFVKAMPLKANRKYADALKLLQGTVDEVLTERKKSLDPTKRDLMNFMLLQSTPDGSKLSDENIRDQILTFLIAGHETTSNLLAWTFSLLAQNPAVEAKALEEAVRVCGKNAWEPITYQQVGQLTYITQILKETLRLYPPAPAITKACQVSTVVDGIRFAAGDEVLVDIPSLHRNKSVWGCNPNAFNPDNFSKENEAKRHPYAWIPFSSGERSCIGLGFALQEAKMCVATLLRLFQFGYDGPVPVPYDPQALTLRPKDLRMTLSRRTALPDLSAPESPMMRSPMLTDASLVPAVRDGAIGLTEMVLVYGSNMGTSEDYCAEIASTARRFGVKSVTSMSLDAWAALSLKPAGSSSVTVFVTSTYNGNPPDNAFKAAEWLKSSVAASAQSLVGVQFAVFACGNKQWARTYCSFPKLVDESIAAMGGSRLLDMGSGDADADIDADFAQWQASLWVALQAQYGMATASSVPQDGSVAHPMLSLNRVGADSAIEVISLSLGAESVQPLRPRSHKPARVTVNKELLTPLADAEWSQGKSTHHIELTLDSTLEQFREGDHFEVWPENDPQQVEQLAAHLGLDLSTSAFKIDAQDDAVLSSKCPAAAIGTGRTFSAKDALDFFVDLNGPLTKSLAEIVCQRQGDAATAAAIRQSDKDAFKTVSAKYRRALDAMLAVPGLTLHDVLLHAAAITPRRYSIASSHALRPGTVTLCIGVAEDGLCSRFLQHVPVGHLVYTLVRPCKDAFHLPAALAGRTTPIAMVAAGTGLAPFLAFLEERKVRGLTSASGAADATLFYGCRHPQHDHIYRAELEQYIADGILSAQHVAYSRASRTGAAAGPKYVQDALEQHMDSVLSMLHERGGKLYVCGSARGMAKAVRETLAKAASAKFGVDGHKWLEQLERRDQYLEDVWG